MVNITVRTGDITRVPADAIVTMVNSGGLWFGGVDGAIMRAAGSFYHDQLQAVKSSSGLVHGQLSIARGQQGRLDFTDVIFVIDDLESPLMELVFSALQMAEIYGYKSITLPLPRTGVMLGAFERTVDDVIEQIKFAVESFKETNPKSTMSITFVVYADSWARDQLVLALGL